METPSPQEPVQTPSPQSSSKLTVILALILTAIVVAFLTYYFTQKYYSAPKDEASIAESTATDQTTDTTTPVSEEEVSSTDTPGANMLLARLERTVGMNANPNSLQLHIVSHKFPDGTEEELANLTANSESYKSVYFHDNKIYYITLSAQLGSYDLTTGKSEIINIPGVDNSNDGYIRSFSVSDFSFDNGKVVYMKGECVETLKCTVGIYDLENKTNKVVLEDLMKTIKPVIMNRTRIESYNAATGIAVITDNSGDAGWGTSVYYDLNVNTGKIVKTDTIETLACGDEPDSMIGPCTPEQEANNKYFDEVIAKEFTMCGDVKVKTHEYWKVVVEGGDEVEEIEDASFVACQ